MFVETLTTCDRLVWPAFRGEEAGLGDVGGIVVGKVRARGGLGGQEWGALAPCWNNGGCNFEVYSTKKYMLGLWWGWGVEGGEGMGVVTVIDV